jgi:hypothetical protein
MIKAEKLGSGPDEERTHEINFADDISAVQLIYKTYHKRAERKRFSVKSELTKAFVYIKTSIQKGKLADTI